MSNAEIIRDDRAKLARELIEARKATLKNAVDALLKGFKPEDIVDALARATGARADQARMAGDFESAGALDALSDDLWGSEDRLSNYEPPERDYYAEDYESAFDRRMREYREKER